MWRVVSPCHDLSEPRAFIEQSIPMEKLPARPAEDVGILKVAKSLGIGTGTVQRISGERAMSLRGVEQ